MGAASIGIGSATSVASAGSELRRPVVTLDVDTQARRWGRFVVILPDGLLFLWVMSGSASTSNMASACSRLIGSRSKRAVRMTRRSGVGIVGMRLNG